MIATYINGIAYYLPLNTLTNAMLHEEHPEWSIDKISTKTGISVRHIAEKNEFASDMAIKVSQILFNECNINPEIFDFIIYCTQSPDYFLPSTACIIQDKLQIPKTSGAFDINLGCSGYIYGLGIAKAFIESGQANNILLITSETYSKYIHPKDKSNKTIFGDAASATWVSNKKGNFILKKISYGTDGSGYKNLIVKNGAIRYKKEEGIDIYDENNNFLKNDNYLYMNGLEVFNFSNKEVPALVNDILNKNELTHSDIDYYIFHQANRYMLEYLRKKIGIPSEKFIYYLENVGNTVSATIPIALKETIWERSDFKSKKCMLVGFGVGYSWAGCIIEGL